MDNDEEEYGEFTEERDLVLDDIEQFLVIILTCFEDMEEKWKLKREEIAAAKLQPLVKSLRLLHALHGYPEKDDEQGTTMDAGAVKKLVENTFGGKKGKGFEYYCPSVRDDEFWAFEFENGKSTLQSLLREPAYMFLEMVRAMFTISACRAETGKISRRLLRNLPDGNLLRPEVWAQCKTTDPVRYGVSLGVRHFVRPLYLYTKLRPNVNNYPQVPQVPQVAISLEKVTAFLIKGDDLKKKPCITCQRFFGFFSFPIIGNCAEYDVIGNVHPNLLQEKEGQQFEAACKQHLDAFNAMMQDIHINKLPDQKDILRRYFKNTRSPKKPKVLKYQWDSKAIGGFELTAVEKWWR